MTEDELWEHIARNVKDLAEDTFRGIGLIEHNPEDLELPEDLDPNKKYRVFSSQEYGSSYGPSLDRILWEDVKPNEEDLEALVEAGVLTEDEAEYGPEWMHDEVDSFVDWGSDIVQKENPSAELSYVFIEDNCVFVHVIEEVTEE